MFTNAKEMLLDAMRNGYAVMAINCCNMEMARGTVRAASDMNAPLIIQISPKQMRRHAHAEEMIPLVRELAEGVTVPVAINFDHGKSIEEIKSAIQKGFTNIMLDASSLSFEENVRRTGIVCGLAHSIGLTVEAELGHVGMAADGDEANADFLTDPDTAKQYVELTGVDSLAVAIGTAHGSYPKGKTPVLDFDRLSAIREKVSVPLVLHGGSGSGEANLREAVKRGISKINVATDAFEAARSGFLNAYQKDPNADYFTLSAAAEQAVYDLACSVMTVIGSAGRYTY